MNIFHFSENRGRKLENFKGIPRRVKIDRKKTMFRNAKYIKGILYGILYAEENQRRFHAMNLPTDVPILHLRIISRTSHWRLHAVTLCYL